MTKQYEIFCTIDGSLLHVLKSNEVDGTMKGMDYSGLHLGYGRVENVDFSGAVLYWASFLYAQFRGCNFSHCDLRGSDLLRAKFEDCNFSYADFRLDNLGGRTSLRGAQFMNCEFEGTKFDGALVDGGTIFHPQNLRKSVKTFELHRRA